MPTIQTSTVFTPAFFLSLLVVALLSIRDFRKGPAGEDIRFLVSRRRYIFGAGLYALCAVFPFCLLVPLVAQIVHVWALGYDTRDALSGQATSIACIGTILFLILMPSLPVAKTAVSKIRGYAQSIAYFPLATNNLLSLMDRVRSETTDAARESVSNELRQYGTVRNEEAEKYLHASLSNVAEIEAIRMFLHTKEISEEFGSLANKLTRMYGATLAELELRRSHMFGRLAQAFVVVNALDQLSATSTTPEQQKVFTRASTAIGCIIEDITGALLASYRHVVASFSVSQIVSPTNRSTFLRNMGYDVPTRLSLPFWPIVASVVVVFIGMAVPPIVLGQGPLQKVGRIAFYAIFANQAIIHGICIWLAIWPKEHFNSARPSLKRLPLRSYVRWTAAAYLASALLTQILLLAFPRLPFAAHIPKSYLFQSIIPASYTLLVAFRTDVHLLRDAPPKLKHRIVDACIFAAFIGIAEVIVASLFRNFIPEIPQRSLLIPLLPDDLARMVYLSGLSEYTLTFAAMGAIIGFAVPATSADAINRNSPTRQLAILEGDSLRPSLPRAVITVQSRD